MNDLFKKRNELARKLASMTPDEVLQMRTGYAGKSQQWQYGFDLACREKQAEIDALKAQRDALLADLRAATEVGDQATPADIVGVVKAMWEELRWLLKQADALKAQNAELLAALESLVTKNAIYHRLNDNHEWTLSKHQPDGIQEAIDLIAKINGNQAIAKARSDL